MQINEHYAYVSYADRVHHFKCENVEFGSIDGDSFTCHNHDVSSNATDRMVNVVVSDKSSIDMRTVIEEDMDITEFQDFILSNKAIDKSLGNDFIYSVFAGNVVFYSV